jgi:voltage-gated potassium channel
LVPEEVCFEMTEHAPGEEQKKMNARPSALVQEFFDNHEAAWEIFMIFLAVIFVAIGFLPDYWEQAIGTDTLDLIDWGLTGFFALEFIVRFTVSPWKKKYLKGHWVDLIAIIPFARWLRLARILRILRLFRFVRSYQVLNSLDKLEVNVERFGQMNGLQWAVLGFTAVMLIDSGFFYYFESPVNDKVQTYWDALYGSLITWMTPGYGDIFPMTVSGRICGLILIISGLVTWGILIANLSAFLSSLKSAEKNVDPAIGEIHSKLDRLQDMTKSELISLHGSFSSIIEDRLREEKEKEDEG